MQRQSMLKELHSIKPFRGSSELGIIRLNKLAYPDNERMIITIGQKRIVPIGFDTYGHPILSKTAFQYYKAAKENTERKGESFVPVVEYESKPFCVKREIYDSENGIKEYLKNLATFKKLLICRKQAYFCKQELNAFVVFNKYILASDGRIYCFGNEGTFEEEVVQVDENTIQNKEEVHIPSEEDVCAICGAKFSIDEIKENEVIENKKLQKVHRECYKDFLQSSELQLASQIIDAVYDERPKSEIIEEDDATWYEYKTNQGTIRMKFKTKVIVIEWYNNFKPFNVLSLFCGERVTKYDNEEIRGIHAWSKDDAIRYLSMAKKA